MGQADDINSLQLGHFNLPFQKEINSKCLSCDRVAMYGPIACFCVNGDMPWHINTGCSPHCNSGGDLPHQPPSADSSYYSPDKPSGDYYSLYEKPEKPYRGHHSSYDNNDTSLGGYVPRYENIDKPHDGGYGSSYDNIDKPHGGYDLPHENIYKPHGGYNLPHENIYKPHGGYDLPHENIDKPHGGYDLPHENIYKPHGEYGSTPVDLRVQHINGDSLWIDKQPSWRRYGPGIWDEHSTHLAHYHGFEHRPDADGGGWQNEVPPMSTVINQKMAQLQVPVYMSSESGTAVRFQLNITSQQQQQQQQQEKQHQQQQQQHEKQQQQQQHVQQDSPSSNDEESQLLISYSDDPSREDHSYDVQYPQGPIRPMERQQLRPWLIQQIDRRDIQGLRWMDKEHTMFRIPWKHRSRCGWKQEEDACLFMRWAVHTGRFVEGRDSPNPKRWKANFRCALNSRPDIVELKELTRKKGHNAFRVYRFLREPEPKSPGQDGKKSKGVRKYASSSVQQPGENSAHSTSDQPIDLSMHTSQDRDLEAAETLAFLAKTHDDEKPAQIPGTAIKELKNVTETDTDPKLSSYIKMECGQESGWPDAKGKVGDVVHVKAEVEESSLNPDVAIKEEVMEASDKKTQSPVIHSGLLSGGGLQGWPVGAKKILDVIQEKSASSSRKITSASVSTTPGPSTSPVGSRLISGRTPKGPAPTVRSLIEAGRRSSTGNISSVPSPGLRSSGNTLARCSSVFVNSKGETLPLKGGIDTLLAAAAMYGTENVTTTTAGTTRVITSTAPPALDKQRIANKPLITSGHVVYAPGGATLPMSSPGLVSGNVVYAPGASGKSAGIIGTTSQASVASVVRFSSGSAAKNHPRPKVSNTPVQMQLPTSTSSAQSILPSHPVRLGSPPALIFVPQNTHIPKLARFAAPLADPSVQGGVIDASKQAETPQATMIPPGSKLVVPPTETPQATMIPPGSKLVVPPTMALQPGNDGDSPRVNLLPSAPQQTLSMTTSTIRNLADGTKLLSSINNDNIIAEPPVLMMSTSPAPPSGLKRPASFDIFKPNDESKQRKVSLEDKGHDLSGRHLRLPVVLPGAHTQRAIKKDEPDIVEEAMSVKEPKTHIPGDKAKIHIQQLLRQKRANTLLSGNSTRELAEDFTLKEAGLHAQSHPEIQSQLLSQIQVAPSPPAVESPSELNLAQTKTPAYGEGQAGTEPLSLITRSDVLGNVVKKSVVIHSGMVQGELSIDSAESLSGHTFVKALDSQSRAVPGSSNASPPTEVTEVRIRNASESSDTSDSSFTLEGMEPLDSTEDNPIEIITNKTTSQMTNSKLSDQEVPCSSGSQKSYQSNSLEETQNLEKLQHQSCVEETKSQVALQAQSSTEDTKSRTALHTQSSVEDTKSQVEQLQSRFQERVQSVEHAAEKIVTKHGERDFPDVIAKGFQQVVDVHVTPFKEEFLAELQRLHNRLAQLEKDTQNKDAAPLTSAEGSAEERPGSSTVSAPKRRQMFVIQKKPLVIKQIPFQSQSQPSQTVTSTTSSGVKIGQLNIPPNIIHIVKTDSPVQKMAESSTKNEADVVRDGKFHESCEQTNTSGQSDAEKLLGRAVSLAGLEAHPTDNNSLKHEPKVLKSDNTVHNTETKNEHTNLDSSSIIVESGKECLLDNVAQERKVLP